MREFQSFLRKPQILQVVIGITNGFKGRIYFQMASSPEFELWLGYNFSVARIFISFFQLKTLLK